MLNEVDGECVGVANQTGTQVGEAGMHAGRCGPAPTRDVMGAMHPRRLSVRLGRVARGRHDSHTMASSPLSPAQTHALFDVLIHHQLYAEIEAFKHPDAIDHYGFPFAKQDGVQTTAPLLQNMLNKFALRLPGVNQLPLAFWQDKVRVLVKKLAEAELSESYDKGAIGARKALATAASSLLEYVARGMLGGYPQKHDPADDKPAEYDTARPPDVLRAWDDAVCGLIYGHLLDHLFDKVAESDKLEHHSSLVQAAHEYLLLK